MQEFQSRKCFFKFSQGHPVTTSSNTVKSGGFNFLIYVFLYTYFIYSHSPNVQGVPKLSVFYSIELIPPPRGVERRVMAHLVANCNWFYAN